MNQEEMQKLRDHIREQVQIVANNPEERNVVVDRLQGTFVDATRECLGRLQDGLEGEAGMLRAVLTYANGAAKSDARVAIQRALDGRFTTSADVKGWIEVWDP